MPTTRPSDLAPNRTDSTPDPYTHRRLSVWISCNFLLEDFWIVKSGQVARAGKAAGRLFFAAVMTAHSPLFAGDPCRFAASECGGHKFWNFEGSLLVESATNSGLPRKWVR
jgi:hypothetical protein